jgi:hypothetical protein
MKQCQTGPKNNLMRENLEKRTIDYLTCLFCSGSKSTNHVFSASGSKSTNHVFLVPGGKASQGDYFKRDRF